jgi:hypothetical protein
VEAEGEISRFREKKSRAAQVFRTNYVRNTEINSSKCLRHCRLGGVVSVLAIGLAGSNSAEAMDF